MLEDPREDGNTKNTSSFKGIGLKNQPSVHEEEKQFKSCFLIKLIFSSFYFLPESAEYISNILFSDHTFSFS